MIILAIAFCNTSVSLLLQTLDFLTTLDLLIWAMYIWISFTVFYISHHPSHLTFTMNFYRLYCFFSSAYFTLVWLIFDLYSLNYIMISLILNLRKLLYFIILPVFLFLPFYFFLFYLYWSYYFYIPIVNNICILFNHKSHKIFQTYLQI